jgi:hypothetical protein
MDSQGGKDMKKLITMILAALALTMGSLAEGADTTMKIPQTGMTKPVPTAYTAPSERPGTVVQVEYDSQDYLRGDAPVTKTAWVYLPYPQLKSHLVLGKAHGITKQEAVEIVTQLAFYCGWPKAWSTFPMIDEVWPEEDEAK